MPSLLDREILVEDADAFGHRHFAQALRSIVEAAANQPPFSIGLLGRWGTGKSSIKELYLSELEKEHDRKSKRGRELKPVTFNAWRYGGENIRRALLRHIYIELGGTEAEINDRLFAGRNVPVLVPKDWRAMLSEIFDRWPWLIVQLLIALIFPVFLTKWFGGLLGLTGGEQTKWVLAIYSAASVVVAKYLFDPKRFFVSRYTNVTNVEQPHASAEQFEQLLVGRIAVYKHANPDCRRILIFLDDLDRLSADEMVAGLDAVRALMEISALPKGIGIVFVISCDEDRIAVALANRQKKDGQDVPGAILSKKDARRYLDRIFQFRLEIPPFPRQDMRAFALDKLEKEIPDIAARLVDRGSSATHVVNRMIHVGVQSPRNALQIVNSFVQSWWVAEHREFGGGGHVRPGALMPGAVTNHPEALAVLSALRVDFPDFYADLLSEPSLLRHFIEVFPGKGDPKGRPERVTDLLERYAESTLDADGNLPETWRVKPEYKPLRQYLSGVSSVPWPDSLQPLLLLSQDRITRETGDAGARLYDPLVSGDSEGVLEVLGRNLDNHPLEEGQARLLLDVWEQVEGEPDDSLDNAAAVLMGIASRYRPENAASLLIPAVRRAAEPNAARLRSRIGVSGASASGVHVPARERSLLASSFVRDALKTEGPMLMTLPNGQTPLPEQATELVESVATYGIETLAQVGLTSEGTLALATWLPSRRVEVGDSESTLPFSVLESWFGDYEAEMLSLLSETYVDMVGDELDADKPEIGDEAIARAGRLMAGMWQGGAEDRSKLWPLVSRFAGSNDVEANLIAQSFVADHLADIPIANVTGVVARLSRRIEENAAVAEPDQAELEGPALLARVVRERADLSDDAVAGIHSAAEALFEQSVSVERGVTVIAALLDRDPALVASLIDTWSPNLSTIPLPSSLFVARNLGRLPIATSDLAITQLGAWARASLSDAKMAETYNSFIGEIPVQVLSSPRMAAHATYVLELATAQATNLATVIPIQPAFARIIEYGPRPQVGGGLNMLSSAAAPYPASQATLHSMLLGKWPESSSDLSPYDPVQVFAQARNAISQQPSAPSAPTLLRSLGDMIRRGVIEKARWSEARDTAMVAWPYFPSATLEIFLAAPRDISIDQIAALGSHISANDSAADKLADAWRHYREGLPHEDALSVAQQLLAEVPKEYAGQQDGILRIWFGNDADAITTEVPQLLQDPNLSADQKERAWKCAEAEVISLSGAQAESLLFAALDSHGRIASSASRAVEAFSSRISGQADRNSFARKLLSRLPGLNAAEDKRRIIQWVSSLGNSKLFDVVIKNPDQFSDEDLVVLFSLNKQNRQIKRLIEKRSKEPR